jgi:uncharacterized membrane protein
MFRKNKDYLGILFLSIAGLLDAGYLSWIKLTGSEARCLPGMGDCGSVNNSAYSELYGIPVAYLGFLSYVVILGILIYWLRGGENSYATYLFFGVSLVGFLFSGYLTYVELGILHAICFFCVLSAIFMTGLFGLSLYKISKLLNN